MGIDLLHSPTVVAGLVFTSFVFIAVSLRNKQRDAQSRKNGFAPPGRYRALDPFMGLDYVVKLYTDISVLQRNCLQYGRTFIIEPLVAGPSIVTMEPDNIQRIFSSVDGDYGVFWRREPFLPFTGRGILTEDGDGWRLPRKLYRPSFAKTTVANLDLYSRMVDDLMEKIPGEGKTVDLHPLLMEAVSWTVTEAQLDTRTDITNAVHEQRPAIYSRVRHDEPASRRSAIALRLRKHLGRRDAGHCLSPPDWPPQLPLSNDKIQAGLF
jgi:cytochrome P450